MLHTPFNTLALNWPGYVTIPLVLLFLFISVLLILTILIQRPAGGGLSGAFGSGAGSGQTAFGAKTGDALTIATILMFAAYLLCAVLLNYAARPAGIPPVTPAATTAPEPAPKGPETAPAVQDQKPPAPTSVPPTSPATPAESPAPGTGESPTPPASDTPVDKPADPKPDAPK